MEYEIKFNANGHDISFYCSARDTRSGFAHDTRLYVDGHEESVGTCYYLNRTWEHWRFQSVCLTACDNRIECRKDELKEACKYVWNVTRVCGKRKAALEEIINRDPEITLYREIKKTLHEKTF